MTTERFGDDVTRLCERFRNRDRLALSRLITLAARGDRLDEIAKSLDSDPAHHSRTRHSPTHPAPPTRVIAVTGGAGVGKSSLIGKLIDVIRSSGKTVAVLACDPQSSFTGGALLGDRIRMSSRPNDDGVFIRSLATPSGRSGVAPHLDLMTGLLGQFRFDIVIVETVGAGQGDTAIRDVAEIVVVLVQPETGDDLQWEKAGQLEIADVVVVHKSDLRGAVQIESQLSEFFNLPGCRPVPVLRVSSSKAQGLDDLWRTIASL